MLKHILAGLALVVVGSTASVAHAQGLQQNFDGNGVPAGWLVTNNSTPIGTGRWGQGNELIFPSQAGAPGAYFTDSYLSARDPAFGGGAVSDWLITPQLTLANGMTVTFWARTDGDPGDFGGNNLELRLSSSGASTNVGSGAAGLGVFTTLLRAINFDAVRSAGAWTQYSASISGLAGPVSGRLAFRYLVDDTTVHGDLIGLDTISVVPEPEMALLLLAGLPLIGFGLRRKARG
jgi:hypothetical protein